MRAGYLVVLSALLVTKAAAGDKEDCETALSVGVSAATVCGTVFGALCFASGWATFGLTCAVGLGCGAVAGVTEASKEACGGGVGIDDGLIVTIDTLTKSVEKVLDLSIKIEGEIQLSQIIALYGEDIKNYQNIRRVFKSLRKNSNGLIMRNIDSIRFARAANDAIDGLAASSFQIFQMMTGGHPFKPESIFQAVPVFCHNGLKNYFLKVMFDCYVLESVARAMSGESMNPSRVQEFKREVIEIEDQFTRSCGFKLHSDSQFEYYKIAVDSGVRMVSGATVTACRKYGLEAACYGPSGCKWHDETKCQVVPIETECSFMEGISKAVCDGETDPRKCAELEGVFLYAKGWGGGDAGVVGGDWVEGKDHTSGDGGKTTFAYCVKAR